MVNSTTIEVVLLDTIANRVTGDAEFCRLKALSTFSNYQQASLGLASLLPSLRSGMVFFPQFKGRSFCSMVTVEHNRALTTFFQLADVPAIIAELLQPPCRSR
jgi:hypothetical protein